jgi:Mce-associated membrane protein
MSHRDEQPGHGIDRPDGQLDQSSSSPAELDAPTSPADASTPATADGTRATRYRISGKRATLFAAILLVVVCMGDGFLWWHNSGDGQAKVAETAAKAAANYSIPLVLSYNYADLDRYAGTATSKVTGPFADDLKKLLDSQVLPAAKAREIVTQTTVQGTSTVTASANTAVLLIFIDQTTRTADAAAPKIEGARLQVTMTNQNGSWLISSLKPI